jgi:hypothetical protein
LDFQAAKLAKISQTKKAKKESETSHLYPPPEGFPAELYPANPSSRKC